jgi:hypothetical protein
MNSSVRPPGSAVLSIAVAIAVLASSPAAGQTLSGRVIDAEDQRPISGAVVLLVETQGSTRDTVVTAASGLFAFRLDRLGRYTLTVRHSAYVLVEDTVVVVSTDNVEIDVVMSKPIPLDPISARAQPQSRALAPFNERRAAYQHLGPRFLTRAELEHLEGLGIGTAITNLVAGTRVALAQRGTILQMRRPGGQLCTPAYYLNGHPLRLPSGELIDDYVTLSQVTAIEVYNGPSQAVPEFPEVPSCGVIVVWTL